MNYRMSEYQIEWPSFNQRVEKRRKTKTKAGSKARDLDNSVNWLEMLETVNNVVSAIRTKVNIILIGLIDMKCQVIYPILVECRVKSLKLWECLQNIIVD